MTATVHAELARLSELIDLIYLGATDESRPGVSSRIVAWHNAVDLRAKDVLISL
jgi:hypothetical protein